MDRNVEELQDEVKVLKNEIKETLADIREQILTYIENPFTVAPRQQQERRQEAPNGGSPPPETPGLETDELDETEPGAKDDVPVQRLTRSGPQAPSGSEPAGPGPGSGPGAGAGGTWSYGPTTGGGAQPQMPTQYQPSAHVSGPVESMADLPGAGKTADLPGIGRMVDSSSARGLTDATGGEEVAEPSGPPEKKSPAPENREDVIDLLTVALLASWLEDGIHRVGQKRLKAIVEVYASMGDLSPQFREVLLQLISLDGEATDKEKVPLRESLSVLAELDKLLWRNRFDGTAVALISAYLSRQNSASAW